MKRFLLPFIILGLASWLVFAFVIWRIPPEIGGRLVQINFIYFFISAWLALSITVSIILYFIHSLFEERASKKILGKDGNLGPRRIFRVSLRRGGIFATTLLGLGVFKIYNLDNLLNSVFLVSIALLLEVYFSSR